MEVAFAALIGFFFAASIYLMLSPYVIRILLGIVILSNAVHLLIFTAGRLSREIPPIVPDTQVIADASIANPLPQALVLTAIVISFSLFAFLLTLAYRAYQIIGTGNTNKMRLAEPSEAPVPPTHY